MRTILLIIFCIPALAAAQTAPSTAQTASLVRRLTVEEAVQIALQNNLGIQIAGFDQPIQDLGVAEAGAAWFPAFRTTVLAAGIDTPSNSFLSGAQGPKTSDERVNTNIGLGQQLRWGGSYAIGWDTTRSTTTNIFSNFSPQLRSSLTLSYSQPLLRNFSIDTARQRLLISQKNREIADVTLRQSIASTSRAVQHAYWDLAYAIAARDVHGQSLELALESLKNTRARVEIGTTPPIDIVEAEAEVAQREEAVIVAEAEIATAEDVLRSLVFDPSSSDFWTIQIVPESKPALEERVIDADAAMRAALANRTDLQESQKNLEATEVNLRYFRNQTLPDVTATLDYGVTGLGGTQFLRGIGFPGPVVGQTERGFGAVLHDLFANSYPAWTASVSMSYPIGPTPEAAALARTRLEYAKQQAQRREQELQVATEVREVARRVATNQKRIETTGASRQLMERRLDGEERKLAAGTSTSFFVFQAQRDLAQAQTDELRALLDYVRSIVDYETIQETPLGVNP